MGGPTKAMVVNRASSLSLSLSILSDVLMPPRIAAGPALSSYSMAAGPAFCYKSATATTGGVQSIAVHYSRPQSLSLRSPVNIVSTQTHRLPIVRA